MPTQTPASVAFIVSANYRDRKASNRWLIRGKDVRPGEAKEASAIVATGVTFQDSEDFERGFGCNVVAVCDTAAAVSEIEVPANALEMKFVVTLFGAYFFFLRSTEVVGPCKKLFLLPDGKMFAII